MDTLTTGLVHLPDGLVKEIIDLLPARHARKTRLVCRRINELYLMKTTILLEKEEFQTMDIVVYSASPSGSHSRDLRSYFQSFGYANVRKLIALDGHWLLTFLLKYQMLPQYLPLLFIGGCHLIKSDIVD